MHSRLFWLLLSLLLLCGALPLFALPAKIVPAAPDVVTVKDVGMAPLRAIAEICGANITDTRKVYTVTLGEHNFVCSEGDVKAWQDGAIMTLPLAPFTIDGCCYAPVRALVTALGGTLKADAHGQSLEITLPQTAPFTVTMQSLTGPPVQLAGATHIFLVSTDGSRVQQLSYEGIPGGAQEMALPTPPSFTADGSSLLYPSGTNIMLRRLNSPTATVITAAFAKEGSISMMPRLGKDALVYFLQGKQDGGAPHLCRMHLNGSGVQSLVEGVFPLFSADGSLVAYTSTTDMAKPAVHIMHADGSKDRMLAAGFANALSPDGTMLYYSKLVGEAHTIQIGDFIGIHVGDGAVVYQRPATARIVAPADLFNSDFSPDSKHVVVVTDAGLLLMDADGKNQHKLTDGKDTLPKFTVDGKKIAFLRQGKLFLMNADGSDARPLATGLEFDGFTFSPDGTAIVAYGHTPQANKPPVPQPAQPPTPQPAPTDTAPVKRIGTAPTQAEIDTVKAAGTQTAIINTDRGAITVELYGKDAPMTVANFVKLVRTLL